MIEKPEDIKIAQELVDIIDESNEAIYQEYIIGKDKNYFIEAISSGELYLLRDNVTNQITSFIVIGWSDEVAENLEGILDINKDKDAYIKIAFTNYKYRGKGLYTKLLQSLDKDIIDKETIFFGVHPENTPSMKASINLGFIIKAFIYRQGDKTRPRCIFQKQLT